MTAVMLLFLKSRKHLC